MVNHVPFPQSRVVFQNQKLMLNLFLLAFCIRYCLTLQLLPDVQSFTYYHVSFCETRDTQYYSSKQSHFATYLIIQYLLLFNYHHYIYGLHLLMWLYEYLYTESREFVIFHLYGVNSFMVSHGYWYIPEIGINMGLKCIYSTSIHRDEIPQKFKKKSKNILFSAIASHQISAVVSVERLSFVSLLRGCNYRIRYSLIFVQALRFIFFVYLLARPRWQKQSQRPHSCE